MRIAVRQLRKLVGDELVDQVEGRTHARLSAVLMETSADRASALRPRSSETTRGRILQAVRSTPGLGPRDLREAVADLGVERSLERVRTLVREMVADGDITARVTGTGRTAAKRYYPKGETP